MPRRRAPVLDESRLLSAPDLLRDVLSERVESDAAAKAAFFGAGPGGYAEGDVFLGVRVPVLRGIARRRCAATTLADVRTLLDSEFHEVRLLGAILAVERFRRSDADGARAVVELVLERLSRLDNWDLVDSVAPYVVGPWLEEHPDELPLLTRLMDSPDQWSRRFALVATLGLIRRGVLAPTMELAERAIVDESPFVHKAAGWMLREVGRRDLALLDDLLDRRAGEMPRVMLRISIEKHDADERRRYLGIPRGPRGPAVRD